MPHVRLIYIANNVKGGKMRLKLNGPVICETTQINIIATYDKFVACGSSKRQEKLKSSRK